MLVESADLEDTVGKLVADVVARETDHAVETVAVLDHHAVPLAFAHAVDDERAALPRALVQPRTGVREQVAVVRRGPRDAVPEPA